MKIDLKLFADAILAAEEEKTFDEPEVSEYMLKHIYEPMSRDEDVFFADLDFAAFDDEDIRMLSQWIDARSSLSDRLCGLNKSFCDALPVSRATRAFC